MYKYKIHNILYDRIIIFARYFQIMNRLIIIFILYFSTQFTNAQKHELGIFVGGSNYIGDIGSTQYINPSEPAFGLLYKWNKSERHAWRFSYVQSSIVGKDIESDNVVKKQRDLSFKNNLKEISAGLEFNFDDFDLFSSEGQFTPYIYSGVSYIFYSGNYFEGNILKNSGNTSNFAIPMIFGLKTKLSKSLVLGLEAGARYSFTDNIDGSNPKNDNLQGFRLTNQESNDWYVFTGFTLSYTFGTKPCYCQ